MENKWNMFCKSPHTKVCLTCHGKRSDWFEKMTIRTNSEVLGLKRDHREIWWCGRGALAWLAIEHLQLSIIQFCAVELEISSPLKWKYITFALEIWKCDLLQSLQKANFNPCLTISNLISLDVIPFNSYPKRQKALDKTMFKFKSTSNSLHKLCDGKSICNSDRCTDFDGSGTKYQIQWIVEESIWSFWKCCTIRCSTRPGPTCKIPHDGVSGRRDGCWIWS